MIRGLLKRKRYAKRFAGGIRSGRGWERARMRLESGALAGFPEDGNDMRRYPLGKAGCRRERQDAFRDLKGGRM